MATKLNEINYGGNTALIDPKEVTYEEMKSAIQTLSEFEGGVGCELYLGIRKGQHPAFFQILKTEDKNGFYSITEQDNGTLFRAEYILSKNPEECIIIEKDTCVSQKYPKITQGAEWFRVLEDDIETIASGRGTVRLNGNSFKDPITEKEKMVSRYFQRIFYKKPEEMIINLEGNLVPHTSGNLWTEEETRRNGLGIDLPEILSSMYER